MVLSGVGDVGTERCWSIDTNFQLDGKFQRANAENCDYR